MSGFGLTADERSVFQAKRVDRYCEKTDQVLHGGQLCHGNSSEEEPEEMREVQRTVEYTSGFAGRCGYWATLPRGIEAVDRLETLDFAHLSLLRDHLRGLDSTAALFGRNTAAIFIKERAKRLLSFARASLNAAVSRRIESCAIGYAA